eukprot:1444886-Pleurochrysis_carterae.AAC.1
MPPQPTPSSPPRPTPLASRMPVDESSLAELRAILLPQALDSNAAKMTAVASSTLATTATTTSTTATAASVASSHMYPRASIVRSLSKTLHIWSRCGKWPFETPTKVPDLVDDPLWPPQRLQTLSGAVRRARNVRDVGHVLDRLSIPGVLALLGLRRSAKSRQIAPPDPRLLVCAFCAPHRSESRLSVGARALSKHAHRSAEGYWGECSGNEHAKNRHALAVL